MELKGTKVLAFVDEEFEDLEMWYPVLRLREAGVVVDIVGPKAKTVYHGKYGVPITTDYAFDEVQSSDYIGLYVPGDGHLINCAVIQMCSVLLRSFMPR